MNIVILDDSETARLKIESLLLDAEYDNLDINIFENGTEAYEFIENNEVDIVFSSIETQGMDGISFVDLVLRHNPKLVSRLFIVTSQKRTEHMEEIKGVGAKRFIHKPINEEYFKHFVLAEINKIIIGL